MKHIMKMQNSFQRKERELIFSMAVIEKRSKGRLIPGQSTFVSKFRGFYLVFPYFCYKLILDIQISNDIF